MASNRRRHWFALGAAGVLALALAGCGGGDTGPAGPTGPQGPTGPAGPTGPTGPAGNASTVKVPSNALAPTDASIAAWKKMEPKVTVTGVTVGGAPVVSFQVTTADGAPVIGLGNTSKSSSATVAGLTNLAFSLAKLVPGSNGSPSNWVSYIVTTVPTTSAAAAPTRPSTDNTGTLVDNGDGSYKYTFYRDVTKIKEQVDGMTVTGTNNKADLGDLTWAPTLVHRLTIQLAGNAPGTGSNTPNGATVVTGVPLQKPFDAIYDFVPSTGQAVTTSGRDIVANAKCEECHRKLGGIPGDSSASSGALFHGGSRNEVRYCVVCHTEQRRYGRTEATIDPATLTFTSSTYVVDGRTMGNLPNYIHKIHGGHQLAKKNYDYAGVRPDHVTYPQDIRNCTKCHDGSATSTAKTAQGDNWKAAPSRRACGSCHDGINFATGEGVKMEDAAKGLTSTFRAHPAGPQADDSMCTLCHNAGAIDLYHLPVTPPNEKGALHVAGGSANTHSAWIASNASRLPPGAIKVSYDIKSVTRNASKQPVMVFRMLQNGARKDFNDFATTGNNPASGRKEIWDNFMGSPSAYFVFAVPQDGIAAPADFNASASGYLRSIWTNTASGSGAGTLSGPDADGYYTVTLTGVTIPDSAVMLTGGLGFSYNVVSTQPLTQTNVAGYPVSDSPINHSSGNKVGGLVVIAPNVTKVATGYTGRRPIVEDARCNACHQEFGAFTEEAIHGGQRNDGTTCAWCHNPNRVGNGGASGWAVDSTSFIHAIHAANKTTYDFTYYAPQVGVSFEEVTFPGVLRDCETCHARGTYDFSASASAAAVPNRLYRTAAVNKYNGASTDALAVYRMSPYVIKDNVFDYGAGPSYSSSTGVMTTNPANGVISPIATACFSCHDSAQAKAHMEINQGSIYARRDTALATTETCLVCHGSGRVADIRAVHSK